MRNSEQQRRDTLVKIDQVLFHFWRQLRVILESRGHKLTVQSPGPIEISETLSVPDTFKGARILKIDGITPPIQLTPESQSGYGGFLTGKVRVSIGTYGNAKQFHQSKTRNNDFDYEAIANELLIHIKETKEKRTREAREEAALEAGSELIKKLIEEFGSFHPVKLKPSPEGGLSFSISKPLTEEQTRELLAFCKKLNL